MEENYMVFCKKVLIPHVGELSRDIITKEIKSQLIKRSGRSVLLRSYVSYTNLLKTIVTKLLSYVTNSKTLIMILVALL